MSARLDRAAAWYEDLRFRPQPGRGALRALYWVGWLLVAQAVAIGCGVILWLGVSLIEGHW